MKQVPLEIKIAGELLLSELRQLPHLVFGRIAGGVAQNLGEILASRRGLPQMREQKDSRSGRRHSDGDIRDISGLLLGKILWKVSEVLRLKELIPQRHASDVEQVSVARRHA